MVDFLCYYLAYDIIIRKAADKWRTRKMDLYEEAVAKKIHDVGRGIEMFTRSYAQQIKKIN